jgi:hypothetical protein
VTHSYTGRLAISAGGTACHLVKPCKTAGRRPANQPKASGVRTIIVVDA